MDKSEFSHLHKGTSFADFLKALWVIGLCRYVTYSLLEPVSFKWRTHLLTPKKLTALVNANILKRLDGDVYHLAPVSFQILETYKHHEGRDFNPVLFRTKFEGEGRQHALDVARVILKLVQEPDFYTAFYRSFPSKPGEKDDWLRPDFIAIFKRGDKAKLVMGEVENPKGNWREYLEEKRRKYDQLARRPDLYSGWWSFVTRNLGLRMCEENKWGFSVWCTSEICKDWRGWEWMNKARAIRVL